MGLFILVREGINGELFRDAVKADVSCKEWRELSDGRKRGFAMKVGTLLELMCVT